MQSSRNTPPSQVLGPSDRLKMLRIDAGTHTTEMVNVKTVRYWANICLIRKTVRGGAAGEPAVSRVGNSPIPNPTWTRITHLAYVPQHGAEHKSWLETTPVPMTESLRTAVAQESELPAPALAEFRRLLSHVGLLVRLVVGRAASTALPHYTGG